MWKVVDAHWFDPVNLIVMQCGNCGERFIWPSRISLAQCHFCGAFAYWHDFNGSEESEHPVAIIDLEDSDEQQK